MFAPPGAADAVGRLEDHEVAPTGLDQLDGQAEPARPRPDDGDLPVGQPPPRHRRLVSTSRVVIAEPCTFATGPPSQGDPRPRVWHRRPGTVWPRGEVKGRQMSDEAGPLALVIGGGSGIGAALADAYRSQGTTTVTWDIAGSHDVSCDVTEPDAIDDAVGVTRERWGVPTS